MAKLNLSDKHGDDCFLPYRESMRTQFQKDSGWWGHSRRGPKVESVSVWVFRDRILEHNLGKSHDLAFSYYCKKARHIQDYINIWFQPFNDRNRRFDYSIDFDGKIQKGSWRLSREKSRFERSSKLYNFDSADLLLGYRRKSDGKIFTQREYSNKFYIELRNDESGFERVVIQGYQVLNVQPNSKQEKRLRNEWNQKKKQLDKIRKENQKQKEYSFLTKTEIKIRESRKEDILKIESHGFDKNSFKGEGYHGRKNKKSKRF